MNDFLLINRYTCAASGKITTQAHKIEDFKLVKSYSKMNDLDLSLFVQHSDILINEVARVTMLSKVNLINK